LFNFFFSFKKVVSIGKQQKAYNKDRHNFLSNKIAPQRHVALGKRKKNNLEKQRGTGVEGK
jgi:hypothetical protein